MLCVGVAVAAVVVPNSLSQDGRTPLHNASLAREGNVNSVNALVAALLAANADIEAQDKVVGVQGRGYEGRDRQRLEETETETERRREKLYLSLHQ
jgi:hypothetical protein